MGAYKTLVDSIQNDVRKDWQDVAAALRSLGNGAVSVGGRLAKNGANLEFQRVNGLYLPVSGNPEEIPSSPFALAPTGATPGTTYLIYAFLNAGALQLERSTTAWALDANFGYPVKSGDNSRTLVGMASEITGPAWADSATQRLVLSRWNQKRIVARNLFTAGRSTASASFVELNTEIRIDFLTWGSYAASFAGNVIITANNGNVVFGIDGNNSGQGVNTASTVGVPCSFSSHQNAAEGYHFLTIMANTGGGATITVTGSQELEVEG